MPSWPLAILCSVVWLVASLRAWITLVIATKIGAVGIIPVLMGAYSRKVQVLEAHATLNLNWKLEFWLISALMDSHVASLLAGVSVVVSAELRTVDESLGAHHL